MNHSSDMDILLRMNSNNLDSLTFHLTPSSGQSFVLWLNTCKTNNLPCMLTHQTKMVKMVKTLYLLNIGMLALSHSPTERGCRLLFIWEFQLTLVILLFILSFLPIWKWFRVNPSVGRALKNLQSVLHGNTVNACKPTRTQNKEWFKTYTR